MRNGRLVENTVCVVDGGGGVAEEEGGLVQTVWGIFYRGL